MEHQKLTRYLEILCQSGCESVNATIDAMENNHSTPLMDELSDDEQQVVLLELKSIMSVYEH